MWINTNGVVEMRNGCPSSHYIVKMKKMKDSFLHLFYLATNCKSLDKMFNQISNGADRTHLKWE